MTKMYDSFFMDHGRNMRNYKEMADADLRVSGKNPMCGDEIHLNIKIENSVCVSSFTGNGCVICLASASLMTEKINGKDLTEAGKIQKDFIGDWENEFFSDEDFRPFDSIRDFPSRKKCALLAWTALESALIQVKQKVVG